MAQRVLGGCVVVRRAGITAIAVAAAAIACSPSSPTPVAPTPSASSSSSSSSSSPPVIRDAGPALLSQDEGHALLRDACFACHTEEMLVQQRLTQAQWTKVVTKMIGWGAKLDPKESASLSTWLASTYGLDAGAYEPKQLTTTAAAGELAKLPDGAFANGDPERGRALYKETCASCHGPEAKGNLGVLLVDRPILYRAPDVVETIRKGKGRMTPIEMKDTEIADVLAHLRRLKN